MPNRDNTDKFLSLICDWIDKKEICLKRYNLSNDELIDFCGFCHEWLREDLANEIICAVMNKVISDERKTKKKR